MLILKAQ